MEARLIRVAVLAACLLSLGAKGNRTQNFIVSSPSDAFSQEVAQAAERLRRDLALEWLGHELPPWRDPCPIQVHVGNRLGAGGQTSFMFSAGQPFGWSMTIQGSRERILDSVLPHEITHTVFATHFGQPLPRWADEGACTTVEDESEKQKQKHMLIEFLTTRRGIAFNRMFAMKQYPSDILPLYAQGYSLARYLIAQGGKQKFVRYIGEGMASNNWPQTTRKHYNFQDLSELQLTWLEWVRRGSPPLANSEQLVAQQSAGRDPGRSQVPRQSMASADPSQVINQLAGRAASAAGNQQVASTGWYARVRDETRAENGLPAEQAPVNQQPPPATKPVVGGSVARQQPVGRPGQVILEWKKDRSPAPAYPLNDARNATARGKTYLIEPDELRRTIRR